MNITIWYENLQERGVVDPRFTPKDLDEKKMAEFAAHLKEESDQIKATYPLGLCGTLAAALRENSDDQVTLVTLDMPDYGLTDELLNSTDVLIWWGHVAHDAVPDELAEKVHQRVLGGMGFIVLHSAHLSKPLRLLLGTSCTLQWRHDDYERMYTTAPTHPIAKGIPANFEVGAEEMYGEYFDIPKPDDVIFTGWFRGGEVFRSGCTWTRGYGKIFYFQPGHETTPAYHNPYIIQIIRNAVGWVAPTMPIREKIECIHAEISPEAKLQS